MLKPETLRLIGLFMKNIFFATSISGYPAKYPVICRISGPDLISGNINPLSATCLLYLVLIHPQRRAAPKFSPRRHPNLSRSNKTKNLMKIKRRYSVYCSWSTNNPPPPYLSCFCAYFRLG